MFCKKNVTTVIWCAAIVWSIMGILSWSHLPIEYRPGGLRLTFNSMIDHMLHGHFDVDPKTVEEEGFLRNGKVYAYWGIFPSLLRLPVLLFPNGLHWDITRLSSIMALLMILFFNYRTWRFVSERYLGGTSWVSLCLAIALAFSGEQVCFFEHSLYQEVCFWALAFASWFVYCAIRVLCEKEYWRYGGVCMAVAAGCALLTRVSMGIGLYVALLCFLIIHFYRWCRSFRTKDEGVTLLSLVVPTVISVLAIIVTAYVNYRRWGNPLTFANYDLYLYNVEFPSRIMRTKTYGLFNLQRFYLGIVYFFVPVWIFQKADGHYVLQDSFTRLIDANELPPSSFFLTDGFMLLCGALLIVGLLRRGRVFPINRAALASVAVSLAIPAFLMMIAISMNYRYRAEFYPDIVFLGTLGCVYLYNNLKDVRALKKILVVLLVVSVVSSNLNIFLYGESELGPAYLYIKDGIFSYYYHRVF
ncbi:hypothetical protein DTJ15_07790 [Parasaccharibacter sp. TMW 2.1891]|uniref:hypothetical protein n=1 Tax=Parasaccharibacter sp. TMW 2.1891 TaxID=2267836 RepID=UPI0020118A99|nr:hypothetical protein [Parasaccharibacter sp. TMW 2.1891]MCL1514096.1 hypothetical protein [Parasaccharibacter sp. TMW 2.1891]